MTCVPLAAGEPEPPRIADQPAFKMRRLGLLRSTALLSCERPPGSVALVLAAVALACLGIAAGVGRRLA